MIQLRAVPEPPGVVQASEELKYELKLARQLALRPAEIKKLC